MGLPLTATRPAAIQASASRREHSPARAITLAMRSPDLARSRPLLLGMAFFGPLVAMVYRDVEAPHKTPSVLSLTLARIAERCDVPRPACGERANTRRAKTQTRLGEGALPQAQTCGDAPSSRPSPRKRGEG